MPLPFRRPLLALVLSCLPLAALLAQPAAGKKVLNLEDYGRWQRISAQAISADGAWMTYTLTPNEGGEPSLRIKPTAGGAETVIALGGGGAGGRGGGGGRGGAGGGGGASPTFSDDSKWIFYTVQPSAARGGAGGGGRGAPQSPTTPPGGRGATPQAAPAAPATARLELRSLATGAVTSFTGVASASFSPSSRYLVLRLARPAGAPAGSSGADLVLHDLAAGTARNIGNVGQFQFNAAGSLLAYTVDATERLGNGVFVLDPATGATRTLASAAADFDGLQWHTNGSALLALAGSKPDRMKHRVNTLHAWTGIAATGTPKPFVFDPAKAANVPAGYVVSEYSAPRWSSDASRIFIGIKEQEPEIAAADSNKANVDVWHYKDQSPQSVQTVQVQQLRRATFPAVVTVATGAFVQLGNDAMRTVAVANNGAVGIGRDDAAYRGEIAWGASRADLYKVDVATGARTLIERSVSRAYGTSPDSRWFLYALGKEAKAFDLVRGTSVTLDASGTPLRSYINEDDDHAYELPLWGVGGWTRDGRAVLLYDKFDVWSVPLDGSKATNLTQGVGRRDNIQFRITRFGGGGGGGGRGGGGGAAAGDSAGIDMTKPITLSAYGTRSKKNGYWTVTAGAAPTPIIWQDKNVGGIVKAEKADRMLFTQQTYNEYPDLWVTNATFTAPQRMTDANPILSEYAWPAGKVLVDYTNSKGQALQGTLLLPAGYEQGKRYPMLVSFYEIVSNTHHNFSQPGYSNSPQHSTYASNGYLVFQPDMVYEIGRPGSSALDNMEAAVKKVIELGYADPARIGLHGHSWSGYQSAFILTQSTLFAAVVSGAPPTNLLSFYNTLYKSTGTVQQGITTVGQVRMGRDVTPFNNTQLYIDQSPIFHVDKIQAPFMILHGTDDGAVDYVEGLQFFNAARAAGKRGILLSYPGEAHNLTNRDNQKDFTTRMKQFFDHYLKGEPAPQWLSEGLPQVRKGGPIK